MQAKDKFLEKINFLVFIFIFSFSHNLCANDIYEKVFNYNNNLKNSSANFVQTNLNNLQEGIIFFGNERIKIIYDNPQKLTIILSEKKGIYINHELEEAEFFSTKKSYIRVFFNTFYKKNNLSKMKVKKSDNQIKISEKIQLDNIFFNIGLIYENDPIKLRRLEINGGDEKIQMGFFNHKQENIFDKRFFSMVDPYLD
jgi:outer membrane lipoprotein-sorting protein